jgi:hypothetical protein
MLSSQIKLYVKLYSARLGAIVGGVATSYQK